MNSKLPISKPIDRCLSIFAIALVLSLAATGTSAASDRWLELKTAYFGDKAVSTSEDIITMDAPKRAYDAATVPIVIKTVNPRQQIKQIHLIVDMNPLPLAGIFKINDAVSAWDSLETRIRINEYTNVRAVAELADGSLHMTSRFVKASGGCSAPASSDMVAAMARAGKMQIKLDKSPDSGKSSALAIIKISHPNNSGMQFDQISRHYIPAFFVQSITAEIDGKPLIDIETNFSMSENPVLRLNFTPNQSIAQSKNASQMLVYAMDSRGNRYEKSLAVDNGFMVQQ